MESEKFRTIVNKTFEDGVVKYFYADVELKDGVASFRIDDTHPLSDDEVSAFNKNKNN